MSLRVHRAADRFRTTTDGVSTWHTFSFGPHYDPARLGVGALTALNDERVAPGAGYDDHRHVDVELVTLVLDGVLVHTDSHGDLGVTGRRTELGPGSLVRTSAGSGLTHAERNDPGAGPLRFLQAWVRPDEAGVPPSLGRTLLDGAPGPDGMFVPLVAGAASPWRSDALLGVGSATAVLWHARLAPGTHAQLPDAATSLLTVLDGEVVVEDADPVVLRAGDALAVDSTDILTDGGGRRVHAHGEKAPVLLLWTFDGPAAATPG